jgi:16S rRNA (adenine1518-N6/adenine1519-N6)-dimethyltransferase
MEKVHPNKKLGQHWLHDAASLQAMCDAAEVGTDDTVLEIGPGLGTLTKLLVEQAREVVAVEFDKALAKQLSKRVRADNLTVVSDDILKFDLSQLPSDYKVAANVPYYITSKIVQLLLTSHNPPSVAALLVQKEVAERMAAEPGEMSILSVATQLFSEPTLGQIVPAELFTPPPEVDSQIITLKRRKESLFPDVDEKLYFKVVKAGFGERRKKLRSSLSGGLHLEKSQIDTLLRDANITPDARAQELSLDDWANLVREFAKLNT